MGYWCWLCCYSPHGTLQTQRLHQTYRKRLRLLPTSSQPSLLHDCRTTFWTAYDTVRSYKQKFLSFCHVGLRCISVNSYFCETPTSCRILRIGNAITTMRGTVYFVDETYAPLRSCDGFHYTLNWITRRYSY